jgi:hypothetical protein
MMCFDGLQPITGVVSSNDFGSFTTKKPNQKTQSVRMIFYDDNGDVTERAADYHIAETAFRPQNVRPSLIRRLSIRVNN